MSAPTGQELVKMRQANMEGFRSELTLRMPRIAPLLPSHVSPQRFEANVYAALAGNPGLLDCTRASLVKACTEAAELGLSLNPVLGEGDILPVWDGKDRVKKAQFRPRYKGLMKLAAQSGEVKVIEAHCVRTGDRFEYEKGLDPILRHVPRQPAKDRGEITYAYCVWKLKNGEKSFEVMSREEIDRIMVKHGAKNKEGAVVGPWVSDYEEMARKTVVRRASKYMPRSAEAFAKAVSLDNLREAGHEAEIVDGEIIDITGSDYTETGDERAVQQEQSRQKQERQQTQLESKITVRVLQVPSRDGQLDYAGWTQQAAATLKTLNADERQEWARLHQKVMEAAEFDAPEGLEAVVNLLKED